MGGCAGREEEASNAGEAGTGGGGGQHGPSDDWEEDSPLRFGCAAGPSSVGGNFSAVKSLPTSEFVTYDNLLRRPEKSRDRKKRGGQ